MGSRKITLSPTKREAAQHCVHVVYPVAGILLSSQATGIAEILVEGGSLCS